MVCIAIKRRLDSRRISNKAEARREKTGSQAVVPGEKKDLTLFGRLSSFCHLSSPSNDQDLRPRKAREETDKPRSWFSRTKSEAAQQAPKNQISLIRKMCGEFREVSHLKNKEEREETSKELEKIRGARFDGAISLVSVYINV